MVRVAGGGKNRERRNNTYVNCRGSFKELQLKKLGRYFREMKHLLM